MRILLVLLLVLVGGCSSSPRRIAESAVEIRSNAQSSLDRFEESGDQGGMTEQRAILREVDEIVVHIPDVQSVVPSWIDPLKWSAVAVILLVLLVLVWHLGLGQLAQALIGWIPRRKKTAAKLLQDAIDPQDDTTMREAVAALRAMDPQLDRAFRSK